MNKFIKIARGTKGVAIVALIAGLVGGASAIPTPVEIPGNGMDFPKSGANSYAADFTALQAAISAYNAGTIGPNSSAPPPLPIPTSTTDNSSSDLGADTGVVNLTGFDYAVIHYGKGDGGANPGGGLVVYYLDGASSWTFPGSGLGTNGKGGLSSVNLYDGTPGKTIPDGGTTVGLLGLGLTGLSLIRRKLK